MALGYSMIVFKKGSGVTTLEQNVENAWRSYRDHPNYYSAFSVVDVDKNQDFARQLNITQTPTIVFVKWNTPSQFETVARIVGNSSYNQIAKVYGEVLNGVYDGANANNQNNPNPDSSGIIPGDDGSGGFGLFNLKLPWWVYLIGGVIIYDRGKKWNWW